MNALSPECVPLTECVESKSGGSKACLPASEILPEYRLICESGECVLSEEPKENLLSCEPRLFYLQKVDACEQNYFCCDELNFFCCETD